MKAQKKLYIIGIDAAALWIIKALYKKNKMKGFGQFINNGILIDMQSTIPPLTPVAWPSIYTGLHPSQHGVMDFFCIDKEYTKQLLSYDEANNPAFWDMLADKGLKSLVITPAVVTKLLKKKNVDMITGWPLPPSYSSSQLSQLANKFKFHGEPDIEADLREGKITPKQASIKYNDAIKMRAELSKHLIKINDYDLCFICFTETDRIQHFTLNMPEWEAYTAPLYKSISDFIEWLIEHIQKSEQQAEILIVSDHGAQPIRYKFMLNAWLINNGYASLKSGVVKQVHADNANSLGPIKYKLRETILKSRARKIIYDKLPSSAKRLTGKLIGTVLSGASDKEITRIHDFDLDMPSTAAFSSISNDPFGMIWINDRRFAKPTVSVRDKQKLKKKIAADLLKIKSVEGKQLVVKVFDGDKYYGRTSAFIHPDIMFELREGYMSDVKDYSKSALFIKPDMPRNGDHIRNGIFGRLAIAQNTSKDKISKIDVYTAYEFIMNYFN